MSFLHTFVTLNPNARTKPEAVAAEAKPAEPVKVVEAAKTPETAVKKMPSAAADLESQLKPAG